MELVSHTIELGLFAQKKEFAKANILQISSPSYMFSLSDFVCDRLPWKATFHQEFKRTS